MGAGYQVISGDLEAVASAFTTESADFAGLRRRMAPSPVDGGDATLDAGIAAVLALFRAGNVGLCKAMHDHGEKLKACHDGYKDDDSDAVALYNKMIAKA